MRRTLCCALLTLLAACAPASGPADAPRSITPLSLEPPPVYALLGYRQELTLQSAQVSALDSIALRVRDRNGPLIDSLEVVATRSRAGFLQLDERSEPLLERIRENHRAAVDEVREVLTDAQEGTACRLFDEARRRRDGDRGGRRARGPGMTAADTMHMGMSARVWSWCAAPPAGG